MPLLWAWSREDFSIPMGPCYLPDFCQQYTFTQDFPHTPGSGKDSDLKRKNQKMIEENPFKELWPTHTHTQTEAGGVYIIGGNIN